MSWQKAKAAREERGQILADMRAMVKRAEDERRSMTSEEASRFDELSALAEAKTAELERHERISDLDNVISKRSAGRGDNGDAVTFDQRDLKAYSLLRAIRAKLDGRPLGGLEREVSDEIARRSGKPAQGFYLPMEIALNPAGVEKRDLNLTTGAGAKGTVTDAANFIELLRSKAVVSQLGARILTGLSGDLSLPKQTAGTAAYWVTEGGAPTEGNATIGQIGLAPKTVGAYTDLSRKFILQSSVSAEQFAREDLATVIGAELSRAALNGSGTGAEPTGILQNGGVTTVAIGTNGGAPTWAKLVELETAVAAANADLGLLAYVTTAAARGKLKTVERAANTGQFIWSDDNTINGYRAYATNQLPSDLTKGTGTALSSAIFGNWSDLIIGLWSGVDILVDPYTASTTGSVRIVALQDVDIKLRHSESFVKCVDIATT